MTWQFVEVMHNKKQTLLFQDYVDLNKVGDVYAQQHLVVSCISITTLWEDLEAKLLTPGQLLGYP